MLEDISSYLKSTLRNNPPLLITFVYIYMSAIGILYSKRLLSEFGIDIFDYLGITDFFVIALKTTESFYYMIFVVFMLVLMYLLIKLGQYLQAKIPIRPIKLWKFTLKPFPFYFEYIFRISLKAYILVIILSPFVMTANAAHIQSMHIKKISAVRHFRIAPFGFRNDKLDEFFEHVFAERPQRRPQITVKISSETPTSKYCVYDNVLLIASTNGCMFAYDIRTMRTFVFPTSRIIEIVYPK